MNGPNDVGDATQELHPRLGKNVWLILMWFQVVDNSFDETSY